MDILIKGIKIPKKCYSGTYCPFFYYDYDGGKHCSLTTVKCLKTKRPEGCPLVALPSHGDLKDETDIIHRIEKIADADLAQDIIGEILASPVIVEATE